MEFYYSLITQWHVGIIAFNWTDIGCCKEIKRFWLLLKALVPSWYDSNYIFISILKVNHNIILLQFIILLKLVFLVFTQTFSRLTWLCRFFLYDGKTKKPLVYTYILYHIYLHLLLAFKKKKKLFLQKVLFNKVLDKVEELLNLQVLWQH